MPDSGFIPYILLVNEKTEDKRRNERLYLKQLEICLLQKQSYRIYKFIRNTEVENERKGEDH